MTTKAEFEKQQRDAIDNFISSKCAEMPCSVCKEPEWEGRGVYALTAVDISLGYREGVVSRQAWPPSHPEPDHLVVSVQCKGCGRVVLFSALAVGIKM